MTFVIPEFLFLAAVRQELWSLTGLRAAGYLEKCISTSQTK